jgi:hypothetical protein
MSQQRLLELGGPTSRDLGNTYWIGANGLAHSGPKPPENHLVMLGHQCTSFEELVKVADQIRADLKRVVEEAREKFAEGRPTRRPDNLD